MVIRGPAVIAVYNNLQGFIMRYTVSGPTVDAYATAVLNHGFTWGVSSRC